MRFSHEQERALSDQIKQRLTDALGSTYLLQRELGGGGMSRVFLATDRQLGRDVVIKTLPSDLMSPDAGERFKREIHTAARLSIRTSCPRIAERLGRRNEAVSALRTYVAIRAKADAAHQADLGAARATLAKLEQKPSGR